MDYHLLDHMIKKASQNISDVSMLFEYSSRRQYLIFTLMKIPIQQSLFLL